jgi:hypothetical protein
MALLCITVIRPIPRQRIPRLARLGNIISRCRILRWIAICLLWPVPIITFRGTRRSILITKCYRDGGWGLEVGVYLLEIMLARL